MAVRSLVSASTLCGVLAAVLGAQEVRPEIRGIILEPGILHPIAEVEVSLFGLPERIPGKPTIIMPTTKDPLQSVKTDAHGAFRFSPDKLGEYTLQVKKTGYGQTQTVIRQLIAGPMGSSTTVILDKEHPVREVKFFLARPGEISGQLVDEETGKPVPDLAVGLWMVGWQWGLRRTAGGSAGKTDAEGRFSLTGKVPGEYLVGVAGASQQKAQAAAEPQWPRLDYPRTYWPGVTDMDSAMVVNLPSGGAVNLGQLRVRKASRYQARIDFAADNCVPGQKVPIQLVTIKGPFTNGDTAGEVSCGQPFFLGPFEPGSYTVKAQVSILDDEARRQGFVTLSIVDKDVKETLALAQGLTVEGRFVLAEGVPRVSLERATLRLDHQLVYAPPGFADAEGKFQMTNLMPGEYRVSTSGLPAGLYASQIRYNGTPAGSIVSIAAGLAPPAFVIELSDKPALVTGVVKQGDRPMEQAWVILQKWPIEGGYTIRRPIASDAEGKFQFTGLAPGDYRIFAVHGEQRMRLEEPGVWERMLSAGHKLSLGSGGFQNLTLAPADPSR